jgi:dCMP deaminase
MPSQETWDQVWLKTAFNVSTLSKDPSTKVGSVLVTPDNKQCSIGYNGFAQGIEETEEMWNIKEIKYEHVIHSELNNILNCPFSPENCTIYITHQPCTKCIIMLYQVKVKRIIYSHPYKRDFVNVDIWNFYANKFQECKQLLIN